MKDTLLISILLVSLCSLGLQLYSKFADDSSIPISQLDTMVNENTRGKGGPQTAYELQQVRNTIAKYRDQFSTCWKSYLEITGEEAKSLKTEGAIKLDWMINADGQASKVELVTSDFENKIFSSCIIKVVSQISFPPPPSQRPVYTSNVFNFQKIDENTPPAAPTLPMVMPSPPPKK